MFIISQIKLYWLHGLSTSCDENYHVNCTVCLEYYVSINNLPNSGDYKGSKDIRITLRVSIKVKYFGSIVPR